MAYEQKEEDFGRINFQENKDRTPENNQPLFRGFIAAERDIPAGTVLAFGAWPAKNGNGCSP